LAFQGKTRKFILFGQIISALFFITHYFLLGATLGAILNIIVTSRNFVFYYRQFKRAEQLFWLYFFMIVSVASLLFFTTSWIGLFPVMGMIAGTYALWNIKPSRIRIFFLISAICWMPYTILVHSYSGFATQVIVCLFVIVGIYRLDK
jgi:phage shock protein PspC (stress-responsive transcriptional regulator)